MGRLAKDGRMSRGTLEIAGGDLVIGRSHVHSREQEEDLIDEELGRELGSA